MAYTSETYLRSDLTDLAHMAELAIKDLDDEREDALIRRVVELHSQAGVILHRMTTDALAARFRPPPHAVP